MTEFDTINITNKETFLQNIFSKNFKIDINTDSFNTILVCKTINQETFLRINSGGKVSEFLRNS